MRLVGAALAGALVAGAAVYAWRDAELDSRRDRLLHQAERSTQAVITADRLHQEVEQLNNRIERLQDQLRAAAPAPDISREPDGRYFGYIKSIDLAAGGSVLVVDFAEFLTGAEAEKAALAAEAEVLDYYVSNVNPKLRTLEISPDVRVTLETWDRRNIPDPKHVDIELLARIFERPEPWEQKVVSNGYWLTIEDGAIARMREQYVP